VPWGGREGRREGRREGGREGGREGEERGVLWDEGEQHEREGMARTYKESAPEGG
jgi:hypothetical protein